MTQRSSPSSLQDNRINADLAEGLLLDEYERDPLAMDCNEDEEETYRINEMSSNTRKIFAMSWFSFTGRSIWGQNVLAVFVFLLQREKPEYVGYVTAIMGISQVLVLSPARSMEKVLRRDGLLRVGSVIGAIAVLLTAVAVYKKGITLLLVAFSFWGILWGVTDAALPSLFIDSIPEGEESDVFTHGSRIIRFANFLGPSIALGIFVYLGNEWTLFNCSVVMGVGLIFFLPVLLILCCLKDIESENSPTSSDLSGSPISDEKPFSESHSSGSPTCETATITEASSLFPRDCDEPVDGDDDDEIDNISETGRYFYLPFLFALTDVISGFTSGMSSRYFSVFFVSKLGLNPALLQFLSIVAPLGQGISGVVARKLAKLFGPLRVSTVFHAAFAILLLGMLRAFRHDMPLVVIASLFAAYTSLMNSTRSLSNDIMAQILTEEDIEKWSKLGKLHLILWSGGAAFGGLVVRQRGIVFNLYLTAIFQALAVLPLVASSFVLPSAGTEDDDGSAYSEIPPQEDEEIESPSVGLASSEGHIGCDIFDEGVLGISHLTSTSETFDCEELTTSPNPCINLFETSDAEDNGLVFF